MLSDKTTTIETCKQLIKSFTDEREWGVFHTPKNLSMAIAAEAAELMEFFLWSDLKESGSSAEHFEKNRTEIEHELADIAAYLFVFCARYNIDLAAAFEKKMSLNAEKYPLEKAKGSSEKYTKYKDNKAT